MEFMFHIYMDVNSEGILQMDQVMYVRHNMDDEFDDFFGCYIPIVRQ